MRIFFQHKCPIRCDYCDDPIFVGGQMFSLASLRELISNEKRKGNDTFKHPTKGYSYSVDMDLPQVNPYHGYKNKHIAAIDKLLHEHWLIVIYNHGFVDKEHDNAMIELKSVHDSRNNTTTESPYYHAVQYRDMLNKKIGVVERREGCTEQEFILKVHEKKLQLFSQDKEVVKMWDKAIDEYVSTEGLYSIQFQNEQIEVFDLIRCILDKGRHDREEADPNATCAFPVKEGYNSRFYPIDDRIDKLLETPLGPRLNKYIQEYKEEKELSVATVLDLTENESATPSPTVVPVETSCTKSSIQACHKPSSASGNTATPSTTPSPNVAPVEMASSKSTDEACLKPSSASSNTATTSLTTSTQLPRKMSPAEYEKVDQQYATKAEFLNLSTQLNDLFETFKQKEATVDTDCPLEPTGKRKATASNLASGSRPTHYQKCRFCKCISTPERPVVNQACPKHREYGTQYKRKNQKKITIGPIQGAQVSSNIQHQCKYNQEIQQNHNILQRRDCT